MKEKILHRVVTFLNREELDFLDDLSKDILFSTGINIPRSKLLKSLVDIFLDAKWRKIDDYDSLVNILMKKIKKEGKR